MELDLTKVNKSLENLLEVVRKEEREKMREEVYQEVKQQIVAQLNGIQLAPNSFVHVPSFSTNVPAKTVSTLEAETTEPVKKKDGRSKPRTPAQIAAAKANMEKARKARMAKLKAAKSKARGGRKKKARAKA